MRRRLALLVAATTSVVLLAFLLPLARADRAGRDERAVTPRPRREPVAGRRRRRGRDAGRDRSRHRRGPRRPADRLPAPDGPARRRRRPTRGGRRPVDPSRRDHRRRPATGASIRPAGVPRRTARRSCSTLVPASELRRGVAGPGSCSALLALVLVAAGLVVADRLARSMTRPIAELAAMPRTGSAGGELTARVAPGRPGRGARGRRARSTSWPRASGAAGPEREEVADLSHRLRTPMTALRLDAEALRDRRGPRPARPPTSTTLTAAGRRADPRGPAPGAGAASRPRCDAPAVVAERVGVLAGAGRGPGPRGRRWTLPAGAVPGAGRADRPRGRRWTRCSATSSRTPRTAPASPCRCTPGPTAAACWSSTTRGRGFADAGRAERGEQRRRVDRARPGHRPPDGRVASGGRPDDRAQPPGGARITMRLGPPTTRVRAQNGSSGSIATARNSSVR